MLMLLLRDTATESHGCLLGYADLLGCRRAGGCQCSQRWCRQPGIFVSSHHYGVSYHPPHLPSCQPHPQHQDELRAGCLAGSDSVPAVQPQLPPAWYIIHQTQTDSNTTRNKQARNSPAGEQTLQLDTFQAGGAEGMWRHVDRRGAARCFRRALVHSRTRKKGNLWDLVQGWVPGSRPSACPPPRTRLLT